MSDGFFFFFNVRKMKKEKTKKNDDLRRPLCVWLVFYFLGLQTFGGICVFVSG